MKLMHEVVRKLHCLAKRLIVFGTFLCHFDSIPSWPLPYPIRARRSMGCSASREWHLCVARAIQIAILALILTDSKPTRVSE